MSREKRSIEYWTAVNPADGVPHVFVSAFRLHDQGWDIHVLCKGTESGPVNHTQALLEGLPHSFVPSGRIGFQWTLFWNLMRPLRTPRRPRILYVNGNYCAPAAWLSSFFCPGISIVYHTQDYLEPGRFPFWEFFERRVSRKAACVISNEPNRARFMASHYGLKAMPIVVPTYLPKDWPKPERDQSLRRTLLARLGKEDSEDCRMIMHEGGYGPVRCGKQLVEAFRRLPDDFILVFTGMAQDSPASLEVRLLAAEWNLQKRILILERLGFEDLLLHTACCDVGILLYPNDGVGNFYQCPGRLTHYIGCGLPVVASNFPGLELLVLKHDLGCVCDPSLPQEIANAILKLAAPPKSELQSRGEMLRHLAQGELAYEDQAWRIERVLEEVSAEVE